MPTQNRRAFAHRPGIMRLRIAGLFTDGEASQMIAILASTSWEFQRIFSLQLSGPKSYPPERDFMWDKPKR